MQEDLQNIVVALDSLSGAIRTISAEARPLTQAFGWNQVALTYTDIADIPSKLASRITAQAPETVSDDIATVLATIPSKLGFLQSMTVPQMGGANASVAVPVITSTIQWIEAIIDPLLNWQLLNDTSAMPSRMARRLRLLQSQIDEVAIDKAKLVEDIKLIQEARDTAHSLPIDLQDLKEAKAKIDSLSLDAAKLIGAIETQTQSAIDSSIELKRREEEASKIVAQCQEAYRIATSTGLAGAFDDRAKKLTQSIGVWVLGLIVALVIGGLIGSSRYDSLKDMLSQPNPSWGVIWIHLLLSALSVAGPIWFAWLSTKQISQRFRLSEDYAYKASVAKAYEGYREEAAKLDKEFEARLFASALTRLEEAPLRLMDNETHGSPLHELINSAAFLKALELVPELGVSVGNVFKPSKSKGKASKKVVSTPPPMEEQS